MLIQNALQLHRQGELGQAADLYVRILEAEPQNFLALQFLGVLRGQQGRYAEAQRLIEAALAQKPQDFGLLSNYGQILMSNGRFGEAVNAFDRALAVRPDFFEALYNKGTALSQLNRFAEAVSVFDKALKLRPGDANCLYNRGMAYAALGWLDDALTSYDQALQVNPNLVEALDNRGNILRALGHPIEALDSYEKAIRLKPLNPLILYNKAIALSDLGRDAEAASSYEQALGLKPDFFEALSNYGILLIKLERYPQARQYLERAVALRPNDAVALSNYGTVLWHLGQKGQSRALYDKVLVLKPDHIDTLLNRAPLLQEVGDWQQALSDYDRVIGMEPHNARAWNGRGAILQAMKRDTEALAAFEKALTFDSQLADALANRATLRWTLESNFDGAVADLKASLAINPSQAYARGELMHLKMYGADWHEFQSEKLAIDEAVRKGERVVRPFVYQALSSSPADLQSCSRIFARDLFTPAESNATFHHDHKKIRIGYVSGEFREQATAYLMAGLYELHDRQKFEIIAIDNGGGDGSAMRRRLEASFDKLIYINKISDNEAAARIRSEEIDILVNLNGYFGAPRAGVFARRAAPVQVNYLGFPATLGTSYMDYIIADRIVIPDEDRRFYDEQVVHLPHSYQVNDRKRSIAKEIPSRSALGLPDDGFVFCNFNQSYKLTPDIFERWMRILKSVDGSVLWLLDSKPPFRFNLSRQAERHGVASNRLIFAPPLPHDRHLARLKQADLFLDSLPYNAHTTASDALWAGVPLLTCIGESFPGRVAASLLHAIELAELVTSNMSDYEKLAIDLATHAKHLTGIKQKLQANRLTTPLFDTDLYRRNLEAAYQIMWQRWKDGIPASGFAIS